jgi:hypothetical protein
MFTFTLRAWIETHALLREIFTFFLFFPLSPVIPTLVPEENKKKVASGVVG